MGYSIKLEHGVVKTNSKATAEENISNIKLGMKGLFKDSYIDGEDELWEDAADAGFSCNSDYLIDTSVAEVTAKRGLDNIDYEFVKSVADKIFDMRYDKGELEGYGEFDVVTIPNDDTETTTYIVTMAYMW